MERQVRFHGGHPGFGERDVVSGRRDLPEAEEVLERPADRDDKGVVVQLGQLQQALPRAQHARQFQSFSGSSSQCRATRDSQPGFQCVTRASLPNHEPVAEDEEVGS